MTTNASFLNAATLRLFLLFNQMRFPQNNLRRKKRLRIEQLQFFAITAVLGKSVVYLTSTRNQIGIFTNETRIIAFTYS